MFVIETILLLGIFCHTNGKQLGNSTQCSNIPSVINTMSLGIDITSFDLFGTSPGWSTLPIIELTCANGATWINPNNDIEYNIPDQLAENPIAMPWSVTVETSFESMKTYDVKVYMSESISKSYAFGLFSKSKSLSESYSELMVNRRLQGSVNSSVGAFEINFIPYAIDPSIIQLSSLALNYIETLR